MKTILEYIWIGGSGELRSKTKVLEIETINGLEHVPVWNYDGSSTGQALNDGSDTEITLKPIKIVPDPFRRRLCSYNYLVLCSTYKTNGTPALNNNRDDAEKILFSAGEGDFLNPRMAHQCRSSGSISGNNIDNAIG